MEKRGQGEKTQQEHMSKITSLAPLNFIILWQYVNVASAGDLHQSPKPVVWPGLCLRWSGLLSKLHLLVQTETRVHRHQLITNSISGGKHVLLFPCVYEHAVVPGACLGHVLQTMREITPKQTIQVTCVMHQLQSDLNNKSVGESYF